MAMVRNLLNSLLARSSCILAMLRKSLGWDWFSSISAADRPRAPEIQACNNISVTKYLVSLSKFNLWRGFWFNKHYNLPFSELSFSFLSTAFLNRDWRLKEGRQTDPAPQGWKMETSQYLWSLQSIVRVLLSVTSHLFSVSPHVKFGSQIHLLCKNIKSNSNIDAK